MAPLIPGTSNTQRSPIAASVAVLELFIYPTVPLSRPSVAVVSSTAAVPASVRFGEAVGI
jgi:hypothetical protein